MHAVWRSGEEEFVSPSEKRIKTELNASLAAQPSITRIVSLASELKRYKLFNLELATSFKRK